MQQGGDAQTDEADHQGTAASAVCFQRIVDLIGGVVRMPAHRIGDGMSEPAPPAIVAVGMPVLVAAVIPVLVTAVVPAPPAPVPVVTVRVRMLVGVTVINGVNHGMHRSVVAGLDPAIVAPSAHP
nr:hypothetical protein [Nakamurella sp. PAMC28650]